MVLAQKQEVKQALVLPLLCLLHHFLVKTEHEAEGQIMLLSCIFFINQSKHSFWVHSWFYQDGRGRRKFKQRASEMVCQFLLNLCFYDGSAFIKYKELVLGSVLVCPFISTLIGVSWPDCTFFGVSFSRFSKLVPVFK